MLSSKSHPHPHPHPTMISTRIRSGIFGANAKMAHYLMTLGTPVIMAIATCAHDAVCCLGAMVSNYPCASGHELQAGKLSIQVTVGLLERKNKTFMKCCCKAIDPRKHTLQAEEGSSDDSHHCLRDSAADAYRNAARF